MKMRIYYFCLAVIALGLGACKKVNPPTINCITSALQKGLLAFYPFNNGSLNDESGNNHHLSNTTAAFASADRNGNSNCAFQFKSNAQSKDFLNTSNSLFLNKLSAFSISLWYQPLDALREGGVYELLLGRGDDKGSCPDRRGEWSLGLYDCRRAVFGHNNSVWVKNLTNPFNSCEAEIKAWTGKWYHVVATFNNGSYKIYSNGNLDESENGNAQCTNLHFAQDIGDLVIGRAFTGKIDDILIYNRELSAQEVTDLFKNEPCCK